MQLVFLAFELPAVVSLLSSRLRVSLIVLLFANLKLFQCAGVCATAREGRGGHTLGREPADRAKVRAIDGLGLPLDRWPFEGFDVGPGCLRARARRLHKAFVMWRRRRCQRHRLAARSADYDWHLLPPFFPEDWIPRSSWPAATPWGGPPPCDWTFRG